MNTSPNEQSDTIDLPVPLRGATAINFTDLESWDIQAQDGTTVQLSEAVDSPQISIAGAGQIVIRPPVPIPIPAGKESAGIWLNCDLPFDPEHLPQLVLILGEHREQLLGSVGGCGWQYFQALLSTGSTNIEAIALRGIFAPQEVSVQLAGLDFLDPQIDQLPGVAEAPRGTLPAQMELQRTEDEEVSNSVAKDGISFVMESRSLSAVVRYIYTPIDGTLVDLEMEINNSDPINLFDGGGITVEMGGREWSADEEEVQRHFVSCEIVEGSVEARWQWKLGDEQIDFLYRMHIEGKTLVVSLEGGGGRATGVELGRVTGASHPRLFRVPYFNFGENDPHILCTNGVFVSVLLDIYNSEASTLRAPSAEEAQKSLRLNGGCRYLPDTTGKRTPLRESIVVTASRRFEEVLPVVPTARSDSKWEFEQLVWYHVGELPPTEESYVEAYEKLLKLRQRGLEHLLIVHSDDTWHDGDGNATLTTTGAAAKGGNDALAEYLEAISDLGHSFCLSTNFRDVSPLSDKWTPDLAAQAPDGNLSRFDSGRFLVKPARSGQLADGHVRNIADNFSNHATFLDAHTDSPPWNRVDHDSRLPHASRFIDTLAAEHALLEQVVQEHPTVGAGGTHWLYAGLLNGYLAPLSGPNPSKRPTLVDFDLCNLHLSGTMAGVGTIDGFFGDEIPENQRHSRSDYLIRYLTSTAAYGHACLLPDLERWGLEAVVKAYYLLQKLQTQYIGVPIQEIQYHNDGNLLETTDALISGAYERSQICLTYQNGLRVFANGSWDDEWKIEEMGQSFVLPPGSFLAHNEDEVVAYSADAGKGRIDFAQCSDYLYVDTRGTRMEIGPITLNGAALLLQRNWEIDIIPMDCSGDILVRTNHFWSDRRTPRLRVLGFTSDDESESLRSAHTVDQDVSFEPMDGFYKYRITLPEWMVEPGK